MTFNISTVREQPSKLVDVIQQTVKRSSKPRRITLGNDSAILCEVVVLVNGSGIRLDLTDNNFSPPKIMPSKMLISVYTRPCNDNKNVSDKNIHILPQNNHHKMMLFIFVISCITTILIILRFII